MYWSPAILGVGCRGWGWEGGGDVGGRWNKNPRGGKGQKVVLNSQVGSQLFCFVYICVARLLGAFKKILNNCIKNDKKAFTPAGKKVNFLLSVLQ